MCKDKKYLLTKNVLYPVALWKSDKKDKTLKLTNFTRSHNALVLFPQLRYLDNINDSEFQPELIGAIKNNDDLQKYILASVETEQYLLEEIDFQVTNGTLNNARLRNLLDPMNFLRKIVSKDILKFGKQNPIIGSLLGEIEREKLTDKSI